MRGHFWKCSVSPPIHGIHAVLTFCVRLAKSTFVLSRKSHVSDWHLWFHALNNDPLPPPSPPFPFFQSWRVSIRHFVFVWRSQRSLRTENHVSFRRTHVHRGNRQTVLSTMPSGKWAMPCFAMLWLAQCQVVSGRCRALLCCDWRNVKW